MNLVCVPPSTKFLPILKDELKFILYGSATSSSQGSIGNTLLKAIQRKHLSPEPRAWDLLSLALSVICADTAVRRDQSPDGWTRQISLKVAVNEPNFWNGISKLIEEQLKFLTTDIWKIEFIGGGLFLNPSINPIYPDCDCVSLLSGGLDSLVGAIDLVSDGKSPYAVSQVAVGNKQSQLEFASNIVMKPNHLQLNHNIKSRGDNERSQRARSFLFLAYGVLAATTLQRYKDGDCVNLYVCENGFISINPPLTPARIGSLSTRTTHPVFLRQFSELLKTSSLRISISNPYQLKTKGEMLQGCKDQEFLKRYAEMTTSCGRYARNSFKQCGRCFPCLIRRAAFSKWGISDMTRYAYSDLSKNDSDHALYDDVRCAAMAASTVIAEGLDGLATTNLNALTMGNLAPYNDLLSRGINEVGMFLKAKSVK